MQGKGQSSNPMGCSRAESPRCLGFQGRLGPSCPWHQEAVPRPPLPPWPILDPHPREMLEEDKRL